MTVAIVHLDFRGLAGSSRGDLWEGHGLTVRSSCDL